MLGGVIACKSNDVKEQGNAHEPQQPAAACAAAPAGLHGCVGSGRTAWLRVAASLQLLSCRDDQLGASPGTDGVDGAVRRCMLCCPANSQTPADQDSVGRVTEHGPGVGGAVHRRLDVRNGARLKVAVAVGGGGKAAGVHNEVGRFDLWGVWVCVCVGGGVGGWVWGVARRGERQAEGAQGADRVRQGGEEQAEEPPTPPSHPSTSARLLPTPHLLAWAAGDARRGDVCHAHA